MIRLLTNRRDLLQTILAGICGTMLFKFTFFGDVQRSNAGTETVLQYLAPVMVVIYVCISKKVMPKKMEIIAILLALGGILHILPRKCSQPCYDTGGTYLGNWMCILHVYEHSSSGISV